MPGRRSTVVDENDFDFDDDDDDDDAGWLGAAVLGGALYAVGGHDGWSYLSSVERYDPATEVWTHVAPMSTPRSTLGVAVVAGRSVVTSTPSQEGCQVFL